MKIIVSSNLTPTFEIDTSQTSPVGSIFMKLLQPEFVVDGIVYAPEGYPILSNLGFIVLIFLVLLPVLFIVLKKI